MLETKTKVLQPSILTPTIPFNRARKSPPLQDDSHKDPTGLELLPQTIPELLFDQARLRPEQLAIDSYDNRMSFNHLAHQVIAASRLLRDRGVKSGQNIGICFHLSSKAVVAILAILNLGAAAVPVDPLHPLGRRMTMLREAGIQQLIVGENCFLEEFKDEFPLLDLSVSLSDNPHKANTTTFTSAQPGDAAFIPFTSGSTGKPKGIVQPHNALVTMSKALARRMNVDHTSRVAQFHPYIFDVSIMEITMSLATGATLSISQKKDMMLPIPGEVSSQLTRSGITHVTLSPTMLNTMEPCDIPTVRVLCVMGEPLGRSAVAKWHSRPERTFLQLWGCTEACILQSVTSPVTSDSVPQHIGYAMSEACRLWIVNPDNANHLHTPGTIGELVVESRALAKGYLNRPMETEKAFIGEAAWKPKLSQGKLYKTGDLAREEKDGSISFIGRLDKQMNYHGERVELGEIDFHIDQCRPSKSLDCFSDFDEPTQTIVGFICGTNMDTTHPDLLTTWDKSPMTKSAAAQMTERLIRNGNLPEYMVPHFWLPIQHRPLTASGKTDRTRLRQLLQSMTSDQWCLCDVNSLH
ncbi:hypothetical protein Q7P37_005521 [Cladosporium fusiforme]